MGKSIVVDCKGVCNNDPNVKAGIHGTDGYQYRITAKRFVEPLIEIAMEKRMIIFLREKKIVCVIKDGSSSGKGDAILSDWNSWEGGVLPKIKEAAAVAHGYCAVATGRACFYR